MTIILNQLVDLLNASHFLKDVCVKITGNIRLGVFEFHVIGHIPDHEL
jgi:hypothetical protein